MFGYTSVSLGNSSSLLEAGFTFKKRAEEVVEGLGVDSQGRLQLVLWNEVHATKEDLEYPFTLYPSHNLYSFSVATRDVSYTGCGV